MNIPVACAAAGLFAAFLVAPMAAFAQADYAREQRLADEITPAERLGAAVARGCVARD
jgi:hypothetical protein